VQRSVWAKSGDVGLIPEPLPARLHCGISCQRKTPSLSTESSERARTGGDIPDGQPVLFALKGSEALGRQVAAAAGVEVGQHEEREFERGEHKTRPLSPVRGRPVAVLHAVHGDVQGPSVNDRLLRLWLFIAALKEGGASSVTALVPYLPYSRKDRRTQPGDPVSSRYVAQHFEVAGVDTLVSIEPHNLAAFENAFRCCTVPIPLAAVLEDWVAGTKSDVQWTVVSPDAGGVKRAQLVRESLERRIGAQVEFAFVEKRRQDDKVATGRLAGEVRGKACLIVDDLVSSGGTLARAGVACRAAGATQLIAAVAHGLFLPAAAASFAAATFDSVIVTDSVPCAERDAAPLAVTVLPTRAVFAAALRYAWAGARLPWLRPES